MPSLRKGHKKTFSISSRSSKGSTASKASVPDFWTPVDKEVETKKEMEPVAEEPVAEEVREEATEKDVVRDARVAEIDNKIDSQNELLMSMCTKLGDKLDSTSFGTLVRPR